jgi:hypothetical protein
VLGSYNDDHVESLIMKGITNNKGSGSEGRFQSKSKSRKIKCFECHKVWYFRKNCSNQKNKKKEETSDAENLVSEGEIFYDIESVLFVSIGSLGDWWILDSGCIFYIYCNISWFDSYKVVNDIILLGDNKEIYVVDVGTIWIRIYDSIVEILEVRHVPEVKRIYFLCFLLILNVMIILLKMEF